MRKLDALVEHGDNDARVAAHQLPGAWHPDSLRSPLVREHRVVRLELRYGWRARRGCSVRRRREVGDVLEPNRTGHRLSKAHRDLERASPFSDTRILNRE